MNNNRKLKLNDMLKRASKALRSGDKQMARKWAAKAASIDNNDEKPWILLGMLGTPQASLEYFLHALKINPESKRAQQGMRWAIRRGLSRGVINEETAHKFLTMAESTHSAPGRIQTAFKFASVATFLVITGLGVWIWWGLPGIAQAAIEPETASAILPNELGDIMEPIPTEMPSATSTPIPSPTNTLEPTSTPIPSPTATVAPTAIPTEVLPQVSLPEGVEKGENWIDVDLTKQTLTAYQGKNSIKTFVVSTGTWQYPTVTGQYQIYVKYESAPMSGPGYYLPGVPYIMYFYRGYGVHGTYWHDNFGTPMSHGCVNMTIDDSRWMFEFAQVGTWVNVHY